MWMKVRRGDQIVTIIKPRVGDPDIWWANSRHVKFYIRTKCSRFEHQLRSAARGAEWHRQQSLRRRDERRQLISDLTRFEEDGGCQTWE